METEEFEGKPLRYIVHPKLGVMWSVADVVRALSMRTTQGKQIVAYAPDLAEKAPHPELPHLALTFMPHEVTQHWLRNRVAGHPLWNHLNRWNLIRKFPTIAAPANMPLAKNKKVRGVAPGAVSPSDMPPDTDQTRAQRSHITPWLAGHRVGVLYDRKTNTPWVAWSDVCQYIKPESGMTARPTLKCVQRRFPEHWAQDVRRVRARNHAHVVCISPALFTVLMHVWCFDAYKALILSEHGGRTLPEVWAAYALEHRVEQAPTQRDTEPALRTHDWSPQPSDSKRERERKRRVAERIARREMGTFESVQRNIKPE